MKTLTQAVCRTALRAGFTEPLRSSEVLSWREQRLASMGFDPERATEIARTTIELYEPEHLLGRGCPPQTAIAILR